MSDRELLELAAKAAGIKIKGYYEDEPSLSIKPGPKLPTARWNPLADDGDALRLAVLLGMNINVVASGVFVSRYESEPVIAEKSDQDIYAATRRAIVYVAATIGKEMT